MNIFGGPNPFQEIATKKAKLKKVKMDQSSSGNQPFRIWWQYRSSRWACRVPWGIILFESIFFSLFFGVLPIANGEKLGDLYDQLVPCWKIVQALRALYLWNVTRFVPSMFHPKFCIKTGELMYANFKVWFKQWELLSKGWTRSAIPFIFQKNDFWKLYFDDFQLLLNNQV